MGRYGTTGWPRGLCSASPGVGRYDAPPPCVFPSCSSFPRQTVLRPSRPRSRSPATHRGPNCFAASVATTTSTKAEQASPTCCERRSTSSSATSRPQPQRPVTCAAHDKFGGYEPSRIKNLCPHAAANWCSQMIIKWRTRSAPIQIFLSISVNDSNYLRLRPIFVLDVSFDAQLGSPATQTSFCHYGNPWRTGGNAIISNTALPPNTLAPTTSRDRTRSQSISLATSFEFGICVHPHFSCDEGVID